MPAPRDPAPSRPSDPPVATLRVGIALGTFRTSVVASNGAREHFGSLVGWPRSAAARKLIGEDVLVGAEAFRFRVALDLVRPFEGGVVPGTEVHERAVADLVRRAVKLARAAPGERVEGVLAVPARAARENRELLVRAAAGTMVVREVVPEAWAAARGLAPGDGAIVVDIGADSTTVLRFGPEPPGQDDVVVLPGGGDAIDLDLLARLRGKLPAGEFTVGGMRELKERYGCLLDADTALVGLPVAGRTAPVDVADVVAAACRAPVAGILEAVRGLIRPGLPGGPTLVLAGCGGQMKGLERMLAEGLKSMGGGRVTRVMEPVFAGAEGALSRLVGRM
ncbi:MAG: hypothetical protein K8T20_07170 [Planctomycetes bacterium]|nr:hypothetical protein [Planctomycetota bacterium]